MDVLTTNCITQRTISQFEGHFFGAGGAFLTKNGKKGERKGRVLRAIVGDESGQNDPQTGPERAWTGRSPVLIPEITAVGAPVQQ